MTTGTAATSALVMAAGPRSAARNVLLSLTLVALFLLVAAVLRVVDGGTPSLADDPVSSSQAWLDQHDHRFVAELSGSTTLNVTAVRSGDTLRGDVQTMDAARTRQTDFYRFRISGDDILTTSSGELAGQWEPATRAQMQLLSRLSAPGWLLAPVAAEELRAHGRSGDAEVFRDRSGNSLFIIDGRPVQVVTKSRAGTWTIAIERPTPTAP